MDRANISNILKSFSSFLSYVYFFLIRPGVRLKVKDLKLKVSQFQNEFMKSSFLPKYEQKIVRISALCSEGRNLDNFLFIFWEKR